MKLSDSIATILRDLGLQAGDAVLVHAGVSATAELASEEVSRDEATQALHDALLTVVGPSGTIAAPAYFYDYARHNAPFVLEESLPDASLGRYPRFLFAQPGLKRSLNPTTSVQALGSQADFICAHRSAYGYGPTSPWARLTDLDARCLLFGAPFGTTTFTHHVEAVVGVPHFYNKIYRSPITVGGRKIDQPAVTGVRYLKYGIVTSMDRLEVEMMRRGLIRTIRKGQLNAQLMKLRECEAVLSDELCRDPSFLLVQPPVFVPGEEPDDGATGPAPPKGQNPPFARN